MEYLLTARLAWMLYHKETKSVRAVCERFNISRKTFYKWWRIYRLSGNDTSALLDRSRRPHHFPKQLPPEKYDLIAKLHREHPEYGQRRIRKVLLLQGVAISERTIWKYMKKLTQMENSHAAHSA